MLMQIKVGFPCDDQSSAMSVRRITARVVLCVPGAKRPANATGSVSKGSSDAETKKVYATAVAWYDEGIASFGGGEFHAIH
jgi:hypothetical protein